MSEMMTDATLPGFVQSFPRARIEIDGLEGWTLKAEQARIVIMKAHAEIRVPRHHHGVQWGIVLDGEMDLTMGDETRTYRRGDCHTIPAGVDHEAILHEGWMGLYVFQSKENTP